MTEETRQIEKEIKRLVDIQCTNGNWNYDPYMHGFANGLLLALGIVQGKDPEYINAPEHWLSEPKKKGG